MPPDFYAALVTTGTLHVVALSGTNITILVRLIEKLTWFWGQRVAGIVTIASIIGFVLFVGFDPPIVRAAIMGGIATIGDFLGKRQYGIISLLFAGGVMLLIWPDWLYTLSFQLSFLATLGIIVFDQRQVRKPTNPSSQKFSHQRSRSFLGLLKRSIAEVWVWIKRMFVENLRTTLAAQIFITPILVYNFGRLSLIAPLINAVVLWSVEIVTILGIVLVLGGLLFDIIGKIIAMVTWVFLEYFVIVVRLGGKINFAELHF